MTVPASEHPNWSDTNVNRPVLETENVKMSRHADEVPSPFGKTEMFVSVQTCRPLLVEQLVESL